MCIWFAHTQWLDTDPPNFQKENQTPPPAADTELMRAAE